MDLFKPDISHGKCGRNRYSEKHAADDADHTALFAATDARAVNRAVTAGHAAHGNNAVSDGANT